jgi:glucose/arabinose dehydrogenase
MVRVLAISSNADGSHLEDDLGGFEGKGKYSDPEFSWRQSVAPIAIVFLNSDKLGKQYENDIFIGTVNGGNIFKFDLNNNRTELVLE